MFKKIIPLILLFTTLAFAEKPPVGFSSGGSPIIYSNGCAYNLIAGACVPTSSGGSATWGDIIGTLSDQTDLQSALDGKVNAGSLSNVGGVTYLDASNNLVNNADCTIDPTTHLFSCSALISPSQTVLFKMSDNLFGGGAKGIQVSSSDNSNYIDGLIAGDLSAFGLGANSTINGHLDLSGGAGSFDRFYLDSGDGVKEVNIKAASGDKLKEVATPAVGWVYMGSGNTSTQLFRLENSDNDAVFTALNDKNIGIAGYPSNRDDSGTFSPVSFLYTDGSGNLLEAPASSFPVAAPALVGNQIGFGDAGTATMTSSSNLTWDEGRKDFATGDIGNVANNVKFRVSDNDQEVTIDGFHGIVQTGPSFTAGSSPILDDIEMLGPYTGGSNTFAFEVDSASSYYLLYVKGESVSPQFQIGDVIEQIANPGTSADVVSVYRIGGDTYLILDSVVGSWTMGPAVSCISGSGATAFESKNVPYLTDTISVTTVGPPPLTLVPMLQVSMALYGYPLAFASPAGHGINSLWNASFVVAYGRMAKYDTDTGNITQGDVSAVTTGLKQTISPSDRSVLANVSSGVVSSGSQSGTAKVTLSSDGTDTYADYNYSPGSAFNIRNKQSNASSLTVDTNGNLFTKDQSGTISGDFNSRKLSNGNMNLVSWDGDHAILGDSDSTQNQSTIDVHDKERKITASILNTTQGTVVFTEGLTPGGNPNFETISGFSGNANTAFTVTIQGTTSTFELLNYASETNGPCQNGEELIATPSVAHGTVYRDNNTAWVLVSPTIGTFAPSDIFVGQTSGCTATITTIDNTDIASVSDGTTSVDFQPTLYNLVGPNNNPTYKVDALSHQISDNWVIPYTVVVSEVLKVDGTAGTVLLGTSATGIKTNVNTNTVSIPSGSFSVTGKTYGTGHSIMDSERAEYTFGSFAIVSPVVYTPAGTPLNDLFVANIYNKVSATPVTYNITIVGTAGPDTFDWNDSDGNSGSGIAITTSGQTLSYGTIISFGSASSHTIGDNFEWTAVNLAGESSITNYSGRQWQWGDLDFVANGTVLGFSDVDKKLAFHAANSDLLTLDGKNGYSEIKGVDENTGDTTTFNANGPSGSAYFRTNGQDWLEFDKIQGLRTFKLSGSLFMDTEAGIIYGGSNSPFIDANQEYIYDGFSNLRINLSESNVARFYTSMGVEVMDIANSGVVFQNLSTSVLSLALNRQFQPISLVTTATTKTLTATTDQSVQYADATSNSIVYTLPTCDNSATQRFTQYTFKRTDATINTVTISGAQLIDGAASLILLTKQARVLQCQTIQGVFGWQIIGGYL